MENKDNGNIIHFPGQRRPDGIIQLRIELLLVPLPVWRQILLSLDATFWDLHVAIQDAMGWEDQHLHRFAVDDPRSGERFHFGIPEESGYHGTARIEPGWEHRVSQYLVTDGLPVLYTYDFGDCWQHEILKENAPELDDAMRLPWIVDGKGACPVEGCGGPSGWAEMLKTGLAPEFDPADIEFEDPAVRWQRVFGPGS